MTQISLSLTQLQLSWSERASFIVNHLGYNAIILMVPELDDSSYDDWLVKEVMMTAKFAREYFDKLVVIVTSYSHPMA